MSNIAKLKQDYPWIRTPPVVGAPMRLIALADMAVEISKAGAHARIPSPLSCAALKPLGHPYKHTRQ
jgi:NAD(P)H-dependent flavin oxidoreductase YrpB (nitropropane dioxygenase family)